MSSNTRNFRFVLASAVFALWGSFASAQEGNRVQLSKNGTALMPVVVSPRASMSVRESAAALADYLGRMSGARFKVKEWDGSGGIAVGTLQDFPESGLAGKFHAPEPARREEYVLLSEPKGLQIIGTTDLAVKDGVWDLLYRLGYRQFFPGPDWEIIPAAHDLSVEVSAHEFPSYFSRSLWYEFGTWDYNGQYYRDWLARNRMPGGFDLRNGHAYEEIIARNKQAFQAHPEYLGLLRGVRKSSKFCISNPGLRRLVADDALNFFKSHPEADSYSVEPSDGGDWCECEKCASLGSISDRAVILANEVAQAVEAKFPGKYIGFLAYYTHTKPPSVSVHPNIIITSTNGFLPSGWTVDKVLEGWRDRGARFLGLYEYYSVNAWDFSLPGQTTASNLAYLRRSIPHYFDLGVRFAIAEAGDNWGANGLGHYIASRLLWNVRESERQDEIVDDFLGKAFGDVKAPMAKFYGLIDGSSKPKVSAELIDGMYASLREARSLNHDPQVQKRIDDLTLYTRYVELFHDYKESFIGRQDAFEKMIRHAYRMRKTMMVHSKAIYEDIPARDGRIKIPQGATWDVPESRNPWKNSEPFSRSELDAMLSPRNSG